MDIHNYPLAYPQTPSWVSLTAVIIPEEVFIWTLVLIFLGNTNGLNFRVTG